MITTRDVRFSIAVACALAACSTVAPSPCRADAPAAAAAPPSVVYVPYSPVVLAAGPEHAFVVLHITVARAGDGAASLSVAYIASPDVALARAADTAERAAATAAFLLDTLDPMVPPEVKAADVTGVFGAPGTWGVGVPAHAVRGAAGWGAAQPGAAAPVLVPPLPPQVARPADGERAAVAAARAFLDRVDDRDGDGAWELASATVKAVMSRQTFERALWPVDGERERRTRRERFAQYDVHTGEFRAGDHVVVCFASEGQVEAVQMRLDDDQEWRVVDFTRPAAAAERHVPGTAAGTAAAPLGATTRATR